MPQLIVNGSRHYYRLEGDAKFPLVVLVHPIGADLSLWDKVVPRLTRQFCVLRYDLRGHGGTETSPGECSLDVLAADLLEITLRLGRPNFLPVGVSIGGMTALRAAMLAPDRIGSLVVCSTAPKLAPPPGGWEARAQSARASGMLPLATPTIMRMFSTPFRETVDASIETLRNHLLAMDPEGYAALCAVLRDTDLSTVLGQIGQRVLVISGALDPLVPPSVGRELSARMPNAAHLLLPGGHFPPLEDAEDFSRHLLSFAAGESE